MKLELSSISNCFPYAPKYCHLPITEMSGEIRLHTDKNDIKKPNVPLILGADLNFLISKISFNEIKFQQNASDKNFSPTASGNITLDDPRLSSQTGDLENFWDDQGDWFDEPLNPNEIRVDEEIGIPYPNFDFPTVSWPRKPVDTLAVYNPAHFTEEGCHGYGIAFKKDVFMNSVIPYINKQMPVGTAVGAEENFKTKLLCLII
jgi:hypothetical protein